MIRFLLSLALLVAVVSGCGGGDGTTAPPPPPPSGGGGGTGTSPITEPRLITLAGQTVSGVDIAVAGTTGSAGPNAESLGVTDIGSGGSAFNSGDSVRRGTSKRVLIFGEGLAAGQTVTITGPGDIAISNVRSIRSTNDTPGLSFDITVPSNAALGARTVIIVDASTSEITTFTGGLEVVP